MDIPKDLRTQEWAPGGAIRQTRKDEHADSTIYHLHPGQTWLLQSPRLLERLQGRGAAR